MGEVGDTMSGTGESSRFSRLGLMEMGGIVEQIKRCKLRELMVGI